MKNRLSDAMLTGLTGVKFDGDVVSLETVSILTGDGRSLSVGGITEATPLHFPLRETLVIRTQADRLAEGITSWKLPSPPPLLAI
ncbi:MAG: hypothetical protein M5U34_26495 [Chloroflexi bacterium]|nr:hypothetical protein [Chloroflexota bacterium]